AVVSEGTHGRACVGDATRVRARIRQGGGELFGELGGAREQGDRVAFRGKAPGEGCAAPRTHADDGTNGLHRGSSSPAHGVLPHCCRSVARASPSIVSRG